jgi:L,D-transpeptidase YcbB
MMQVPVGWRICMLSVVIFACLSAGSVAVPQSVVRQPLVASMPEQLKSQIEAVGRTPSISIRREILGAPDALLRFYKDRGFRPLWLGNDGPLPQADGLLQVIRQAEREGIKPIGYHLSCIAQLLAEVGRRDAHDQPQSLRAWVDLELLLTDALFMWGSHVLTGRINPPRPQRGMVWGEVAG